jgi:hypothetical protein
VWRPRGEVAYQRSMPAPSMPTSARRREGGKVAVPAPALAAAARADAAQRPADPRSSWLPHWFPLRSLIASQRVRRRARSLVMPSLEFRHHFRSRVNLVRAPTRPG